MRRLTESKDRDNEAHRTGAVSSRHLDNRIRKPRQSLYNTQARTAAGPAGRAHLALVDHWRDRQVPREGLPRQRGLLKPDRPVCCRLRD